MFTHTLSKPADNWFLQKQMHDPLVYSDFEEGSEVVVCGGCRQVFLAICWDDTGDGCPFCHTTYTVPFSRKALQHGGRSSFKIKSRSAAKTKRGSAIPQRHSSSFAQTFDRLVEGLARLLCLHVKPAMALLLPVTVFCLVMVQASSIVFFDNFPQQFPDAFARTQWAATSMMEETVQAAANALDETARSVTDALDKINLPLDRITQSFSDAVGRAISGAGHFLENYLPW